ncbi:abortive infection system antitoxin AbiGi family protein [Psychromonas sp.]|nr:abortive infection system antitoxin AbiGi family protein [Psychromonas sp.]
MSQRYFSNIYWHFTGSPEGVDWSQARCPKDITEQGPVLDDGKAAETLRLILDSSMLKATCTEKISEALETDKFCCVTDIPFKDLPSHSLYYGKVAIGFKAEAIHSHFVPVLYIPKQNLPAVSKLILNPQLQAMAAEYLCDSGGFQEQQAMKLLAQASQNKVEIQEIDEQEVGGFYSNFVKITDFDTDAENSYYREREWRCIGDFRFDSINIEAVVGPEEVLPIIRKKLEELNIYHVNVVSWEFIENA